MSLMSFSYHHYEQIVPNKQEQKSGYTDQPIWNKMFRMKQNAKDRIAKFLKDKAKELGMADAEIARRVKVSARTYGYYASARSAPPFDKFLEICDFFSTTPNEILGYDGAAKKVDAEVLAVVLEKIIDKLKDNEELKDLYTPETIASVAATYYEEEMERPGMVNEENLTLLIRHEKKKTPRG
jgi:transcriptional regulator with XRE-family HTH domain